MQGYGLGAGRVECDREGRPQHTGVGALVVQHGALALRSHGVSARTEYAPDQAAQPPQAVGHAPRLPFLERERKDLSDARNWRLPKPFGSSRKASSLRMRGSPEHSTGARRPSTCLDACGSAKREAPSVQSWLRLRLAWKPICWRSSRLPSLQPMPQSYVLFQGLSRAGLAGEKVPIHSRTRAVFAASPRRSQAWEVRLMGKQHDNRGLAAIRLQ